MRIDLADMHAKMSFRVGEAASLLGVSDDTVRRWADAGRLTLTGTPASIEGVELAALAQELGVEAQTNGSSARNRLTGIVTKVTRDTVMAQVELQAGPFRIVSLISREAADELGLEPGVLAVASVKATNVGIELA
jgi:molybdopterin-binding protein